MTEAILLAIALAMDATAVAAARGVLGMTTREAILLASSFAVFQAGMAAIGWLLGDSLASHLGGWDRWIAFALLTLIGGKMLWEALRHDDGEPAAPRTLRLRTLIGLSIATSIDALAAGVTLVVLPVSPPLSLFAIGVATLVLSLAGGLGAAALGARAGKKLEIAGGLVLIGIAIKTVVV